MDFFLKGMDIFFFFVKVISFVDVVLGVVRCWEEFVVWWFVVEDVLEEMFILCSEELWDVSFCGDFVVGVKWWNICFCIDVEEVV